MLYRVLRYIKSPFKLPLMGVMLLWALTMPGQEVEVYKFLLSFTTGKPAPGSSSLKTGVGHSDTPKVQQEAVHAFPDAKPAKAPLLKLFPAVQGSASEGFMPLVLAFSLPSLLNFPWEVVAQEKLLLFSLQPNAP
ncbi:hypothetical protein [Sabulibacter ruber]|uniref:hypothetical protein n=1 Tax=Sabulibacter ruber TaxID=2811901 RepID=UPI001A95AA08|nr:hypothetical protein [Sabulibacter ruber]